MNIKMENKAKFEIVDAILRKLDIAMEYNGDVRKIILDFVSQLSPDEHTATLNELEDAGAIKGFKKGDDCFYILDPNKSRLYKIKEALRQPTIHEPHGQRKLSFDPKSGKILWGEKECELPFKKTEYYIAKALFDQPTETKIKENNLVTYLDSEACEADSPSRIYDGVRRINQRVLKDLGIKNLISYKAANYWIRTIE